MKTKQCKHCKSEMPANAKVCAKCGRKQGGKAKWIILGVIALIIIGAVASGGGGDSSEGGDTAATASVSTAAPADAAKKENKANTKAKEQPVEYTACTADELAADLEKNAASASKKYKGQYLEVTGKLENIDSDGAYINLGTDEQLIFVNIQCFLKTEEQKEAILNLSTGDTVTVKGKCTDVGEILGYTLDVDSLG